MGAIAYDDSDTALVLVTPLDGAEQAATVDAETTQVTITPVSTVEKRIILVAELEVVRFRRALVPSVPHARYGFTTYKNDLSTKVSRRWQFHYKGRGIL